MADHTPTGPDKRYGVTEDLGSISLLSSGAGDEVIMSIAGDVSRAILYSHVRMEAKRRALDEIAARQRGVD